MATSIVWAENAVGASGNFDFWFCLFQDSPNFVYGCKCRYFFSGDDPGQRPGTEEKNKIVKNVKSMFA